MYTARVSGTAVAGLGLTCVIGERPGEERLQCREETFTTKRRISRRLESASPQGL